MECFDISNISTTHIVASMVAFKNGIPDKANYRRFRIKGVKGQNDFASMAEVVRRRYARVLLEARELHPDVAEFSQENPQEALRASAPRERELHAPVRADGGRRGQRRQREPAGGPLIEGPGYEADETDVELDDEIEREEEAEALDETQDAHGAEGAPGVTEEDPQIVDDSEPARAIRGAARTAAGPRSWWTAARASSGWRARSCNGSGCTRCPSSGWPRSSRKFIVRAGPRRCGCRRIRARCGCSSASATRRTVSPTATTNC